MLIPFMEPSRVSPAMDPALLQALLHAQGEVVVLRAERLGTISLGMPENACAIRLRLSS